MFSVCKPEELFLMQENRFIGTAPVMVNSQISFAGEGNLLFCDADVKLENCRISFAGNNSILYLSKSIHPYKIKAWLYNESSVFFGENNYINDILCITASERKNILIGSEGLFSTEIWIRNSDAHLLYDSASKQRINSGKSVYIGDHVWIGQQVMLLKGVQISSGAVIGAGSVLSNKHVPSNTAWAGNPARQIRKEIFWDGRCVHRWMEDMTEASMHCDQERAERFLFHHNLEEYIPYEELEKRLTRRRGSDDKLAILCELSGNFKKDRFSF